MSPEKLPRRTKIQLILAVAANMLRKVPRIAFFMLAFFAIFWVGQQLYYRFAPAESFLNYYYAKVDDSPIGTEPLATLCRRVSTEGIRIQAVRTFIKYEDVNGKPTTVGEYQFTAGVEQLPDGSNCQNVRLRKQPQVKGTYSVHTEYVFEINGYRKSGAYDTNKYKMTETQQSLDLQIRTLQDQIDILRQQLTNNGGDTTTTGSSPSTASPSTNGQPREGDPPAQRSNGSSGSNPPQAVPPQTPDTPITPAAPSETCIIDVLGLKVGCTSTRTN